MLRSMRIPIVIVLIGLAGCHPTQPFYLHETGDLSHYMEKSTQVEHADVDVKPLDEVERSIAPITISDPDFVGFWDLRLEDCISIALNNAKIIRGGAAPRIQQGQILAGSQEGSLADVPSAFATVYNPAIRESAAGGEDGTGVEAALAAFDTQMRIFGNQGNNGFLGLTDRPQNINTAIAGNNFFPTAIQTVNGGMIAQLQKKAATGTTFSASSITDYSRGNSRGQIQALNRQWTQSLELRADQPLLRGRGEQINRIPVVIARIGTDVEIAQLEARLQKMLCNVEIRYWDLYNAYRNLEAAISGRNSTQVTWRTVYERTQGGVDNAQAEAQARAQYFQFRAQVEQSLRDLHNVENELRLLMGLAPTDGRLIRPQDEPTLARVKFDWSEILAEAMIKRPELRQKRWDIKRRELELILARNNLLPTLNVGALYRWVGLGQDWIRSNRNGRDFPAPGSNAWDNLLGGRFQEWGLAGEFQMPVGFRRELAAVTNAQLKVARERAFLEDMELDITHGLTRSVRTIDADYALAQTYFNQWAASEREVEAAAAVYDAGVGTGNQPLNLLLEAQRRRATAQSLYYQWISEYNKALADLHCRKGSILEYNDVVYEEGAWPKKAYWDAVGLARERDAARRLDYGWTRPNVSSLGTTAEAYPNAALTTGSQPDVVAPAPPSSPRTAPTPAAMRESLPATKGSGDSSADADEDSDMEDGKDADGPAAEEATMRLRGATTQRGTPAPLPNMSFAHESYYRPPSTADESKRSVDSSANRGGGLSDNGPAAPGAYRQAVGTSTRRATP